MISPLKSLPTFVSAAAVLVLAACESNRDVSGGDTSSQGTMIATTRANSGGGKPAFETAGDPEGIARLRGRLFYVKDRGTSLLKGRQRVTRGLYLESNGAVTLADGRRVNLPEGYMVTTGGDVIEAPAYLR